MADMKTPSIDPAASKVREAAGEGISDARFKAEDQLAQAKADALEAEVRARHGGNRAHWKK